MTSEREREEPKITFPIQCKKLVFYLKKFTPREKYRFPAAVEVVPASLSVGLVLSVSEIKK